MGNIWFKGSVPRHDFNLSITKPQQTTYKATSLFVRYEYFLPLEVSVILNQKPETTLCLPAKSVKQFGTWPFEGWVIDPSCFTFGLALCIGLRSGTPSSQEFLKHYKTLLIFIWYIFTYLAKKKKVQWSLIRSLASIQNHN